jgi:hypothetical protein
MAYPQADFGFQWVEPLFPNKNLCRTSSGIHCAISRHGVISAGARTPVSACCPSWRLRHLQIPTTFATAPEVLRGYAEQENANSLDVTNALLGQLREEEVAEEDLMVTAITSELNGISTDLGGRWNGAIYALRVRLRIGQWLTLRNRRLPRATWIMASETSRRFS